MYEGNQAMTQAGAALGCYKEKDPMQQMTCGENLERNSLVTDKSAMEIMAVCK